MAEFVFLSWSVGCERGGVPTAGRSQSQDSAPVFDLPSKDVASGVRMLPFDFASIRKRAGGGVDARSSLLAVVSARSLTGRSPCPQPGLGPTCYCS